MAHTTMGPITVDYRGEVQQFTTVSQVLNFLRQERIKVGWFHKVKAAVDIVEDDKISQTRNLKGDKFHIMTKLTEMEDDIKRASA
jgi:hypothetical protein